ncbi:uncharacterized protein DS421_2g38980 [Arachis hypogaea]|nr:uncharacterized protein DS421_2g38980 [Arachis hypogaea]
MSGSEEGRRVIDEVLLNDLNFKNHNLNKAVYVIDSDRYTECNGKEDFGGFGLVQEVSSERTVTQAMDVCGGGVHGDTRLGGVKDLGFSYKDHTKGDNAVGGGLGLELRGPNTTGQADGLIRKRNCEDQEGANVNSSLDLGYGRDSDGVRWAGLGTEPGRTEVVGITKNAGKGKVQAWALCSQAMRRCPGLPDLDDAAARRAEMLELGPSRADARDARDEAGRCDSECQGTDKGGRVASLVGERTARLMEPDEEG